MPSNIGTAYVQIVPSATGISSQIGAQIAPGASKAGTMAGQKVASGMSSKLKSVGGGLMKAGAIATAVSVPIIAGIKKAMDAYQVQNAAETKLTEIYKTRMGVGKKAAKATMDLAGAIQKEGVVGDEVTLSGAQQLATFAKYPGTVNKLLPAMDNLLVQQKGLNGTEQDATQIANLMGKVMQGQTGALKRVGVSFTAAEEKVLKYGTEEEKAAMLSKVITNNVGDMNKAMLNTPEGKIQQMKNAMGDLAEKVGATLAPVLADIAKWVSANLIPKVEAFMKFLQGNPIIAKIVVGITGLLAIGGPLLIIIGSIVSAIGALLPVLGAISAPVLAIVGVITAVVAALVYAWTNCESFREAVKNMISQIIAAVKPIIPIIGGAIKQVMGIISNLIKQIASALIPVIKTITPIITKIISIIIKVAQKVMPILISAFKLVATVISTVVRMASTIIVAMVQLIKKAWNGIKSATKTVWNAIKSAVTVPINAVKSVVSKVVGTVKKLLSFEGLKNTISNVFNAIKKVITTPISAAKTAVVKIVGGIKKLFSFKFKWPSIPLPHFTVKPKGWKVGDLLKGKIPSLGIDFYARGGIFDEKALGVFGEAGPEAAVPLSGKRKMRPFAKAIAEQMGPGGNTYNIGDVTLNVEDLKDVLTLEKFVEVVQKAKGLKGAR